MKNINIKKPKGWRTGQTIFNFLQWLHLNKNKGIVSEQSTRMADPFHISDWDLEKLYDEYLKVAEVNDDN